MRPRHRAAALLVLLAAAGAGCRHAAVPPAPLPEDWRSLVREPAPFAALYRLEAGGQRNLVLTARGGGGGLSLTVAVPPGGAALAVWVADDAGWVERVKERCREPLPHGAIPLGGGAALPLDARLATLLLSGLAPDGAHEAAGAPGWVEATAGDLVWRAHVEGPPAVCTRVVITGRGGAPLLAADLGSHVGRVPGTLRVETGSERAEMKLQEWHLAEAPAPPAWLSLAACGAAR